MNKILKERKFGADGIENFYFQEGEEQLVFNLKSLNENLAIDMACYDEEWYSCKSKIVKLESFFKDLKNIKRAKTLISLKKAILSFIDNNNLVSMTKNLTNIYVKSKLYDLSEKDRKRAEQSILSCFIIPLVADFYHREKSSKSEINEVFVEILKEKKVFIGSIKNGFEYNTIPNEIYFLNEGLEI